MINNSQKNLDKNSTKSLNLQEQPLKENYRCSNHLKEVLQRSEQLLNKAERLQKELSNRFYSVN